MEISWKVYPSLSMKCTAARRWLLFARSLVCAPACLLVFFFPGLGVETLSYCETGCCIRGGTRLCIVATCVCDSMCILGMREVLLLEQQCFVFNPMREPGALHARAGCEQIEISIPQFRLLTAGVSSLEYVCKLKWYVGIAARRLQARGG